MGPLGVVFTANPVFHAQQTLLPGLQFVTAGGHICCRLVQMYDSDSWAASSSIVLWLESLTWCAESAVAGELCAGALRTEPSPGSLHRTDCLRFRWSTTPIK